MTDGLFDLLYIIDSLMRFLVMGFICLACYKFIYRSEK